jgi:hypothetical protein
MAALLELPCLAESPGPSTSGHVKPPPSMSRVNGCDVARPHRLPAATEKSRSAAGVLRSNLYWRSGIIGNCRREGAVRQAGPSWSTEGRSRSWRLAQ